MTFLSNLVPKSSSTPLKLTFLVKITLKVIPLQGCWDRFQNASSEPNGVLSQVDGSWSNQIKKMYIPEDYNAA